jgi:2-polyprenyl-3-methyl-5-hydroxy-6-metoxy-1,4-benzoquinol methylase
LKGLPGCQLSLDPSLGSFERAYIRVFGAPFNGLRIRLRRVLPLTRGSHDAILDAGCGSGVFAMEVAKLHPEAHVTGVDIEQPLIDRANQVARDGRITNCAFEVGDVTDLRYEARFDLALSVDNLEHVTNDVDAMKALRRSLRPGGMLVVHTPAYYRRWFFVRRRENFHVPGHVRPGYTAEQLVSRLTSAGLEVLDQTYTYGVLENFTNNVSYVISGAERKNKLLYSLVFPLLLALSYPGRFFRPKWGAGVLVKARRPLAEDAA